jgi:hypothetical protein
VSKKAAVAASASGKPQKHQSGWTAQASFGPGISQIRNKSTNNWIREDEYQNSRMTTISSNIQNVNRLNAASVFHQPLLPFLSFYTVLSYPSHTSCFVQFIGLEFHIVYRELIPMSRNKGVGQK